MGGSDERRAGEGGGPRAHGDRPDFDPGGVAAADEVPLLAQVDAPRPAAAVTLSSGRRYELTSGEAADRLVIRGRRGEVILRVEVTDRGPVLSFSGAEVTLSAARRLALAAPEVEVRAEDTLTLSAGGDARLEAAAVELQASAGHVEVLAMKQIALDGERIGLNDKPAPAPFPWSRLSDEEEERSQGGGEDGEER